jgi:hypothetical protein
VISGRSAPAQAQPVAQAPPPPTDLDHNERFWTKVAIVVGGAILLLPFVLR